jgi:hypothetical protein
MVFFDTRSTLVRTQEYELRTSISWDVDGHLIWDMDGYSRTGRRAAVGLPRFTISLSLSLSRILPRRFAFSLLFPCCWIGLTGTACTLTQCSSILEKLGPFLFSAEQRVSKLLCFSWEDRRIGFFTAKENYRSRVFGNSQFVS